MVIRQLMALWVVSLLTLTGWAHAGQDDVLTVRVGKQFEETLDKASEVLEKHGFTVAHVQKCDGGLNTMGYETDHYRVIFFGRLDEVRELSKTHPQLIPLFPFKLAVYAEDDDSILSVINPGSLDEMLQADQELAEKLVQWEREFKAVLNDVRSVYLADSR